MFCVTESMDVPDISHVEIIRVVNLPKNGYRDTQQNNPSKEASNQCSSDDSSHTGGTGRTVVTWRATYLTDCCCNSPKFNGCFSAITSSPGLDSIDHISCSHTSTITWIHHCCCESGTWAIVLWACQLRIFHVNRSKVTRTLFMYHCRQTFLKWQSVVL